MTHAPSDPRHVRRAQLMQQLFAYSFQQDQTLKPAFEESHSDLKALFDLLPEIDTLLQSAAPERPLTQINKVDLAILRVIVFEWKTSQTPQKVLIDEGVELAKEFGTESSPRFVNGVLAKLLMK